MALKDYPNNSFRKCFWRWYLNTTGTGDNVFQKAANNLVLYTTVNKTTTFYRMLGTVRVRVTNVHPRVKRMMTMLNLYLGIYVHRTLKNGFDRIKKGGKPKKLVALERLISASQKRKKNAVGLWVQEARKRREEANKKRAVYADCARALIEASVGAKRNSFSLWRKKAFHYKRTLEIQKRFMTKLLMSRAGKVIEAFKTIRNLPGLVDMEKRKKALKFEKGLSKFLDKNIVRTFGAFKRELEEGSALKKRGAIQIINITQGDQKRMYNRWVKITERSKLMNECKEVASIFANLNFTVKSISDNAFL